MNFLDIAVSVLSSLIGSCGSFLFVDAFYQPNPIPRMSPVVQLFQKLNKYRIMKYDKPQSFKKEIHCNIFLDK